MSYECSICEKEFENPKAIGGHVVGAHDNPMKKEEVKSNHPTLFGQGQDPNQLEGVRRPEHTERMKDESNPNWKGGMVQKECKECGNTFRVKPYLSEKAKFCSPECFWSYAKENEIFAGENHYHWKGGKKSYYGSNWNRQREKALERDNHTCQKCGASQEEATLDVHHITPIRKFDNPEEANKLKNLKTICHSCHSKIDT